MIGALEALNPATEMAGVAAMMLFLSALWRRQGDRWGRNCAFLGVALLGAVAVCSHDVMNLPEVCGLGVIGCAAGLMLAREWPADRLQALLAGAAGMAGVAAATASLGALRNAYAFGLLNEVTDGLISGAAVTMALTLALGMMAGGGGVAIMTGRAILGRATWPGAVATTATVLAAARFAQDSGDNMAGALMVLGFLSGLLLISRVMDAGIPVALALVGGIAGWSAAAMGLLLQDMGLVVAGGMAGGLGSMLALRPLRPAAQKGLADSGTGA